MMTLFNKKGLISSILLIAVSTLSSCDKFLMIDPPVDQISPVVVFYNDDAAISAVTGIYGRMINGGTGAFASGSVSSVTSIAGLSADEFINYNSNYEEFYRNNILPGNAINSALWSGIYQYIYSANGVIEGLENASGVNPSLKTQLEGEAKFIRAFCLFYLTNIYGDIPMPLTTNYRQNTAALRTEKATIYKQIVNDLLDAQLLLRNEYISTERVRPNSWSATALLSRVYLYMEYWPQAEEMATNLISQQSMYRLQDDLKDVFLKNNPEAIWQLMPNKPGFNTNEADLFILSKVPDYVSMTSSLFESFAVGDKRLEQWTRTLTSSGNTFYYPYKYKIKAGTNLTEYSMVLRLAEQYLIRAEARIQQDKVGQGIEDLNALRNRARTAATLQEQNPLPPIPADLLKGDAMLALEKERRIELFSEWGHRWFDLKRTHRSEAVLKSIKGSGWENTDELYPIPETERNANPNISQNSGY